MIVYSETKKKFSEDVFANSIEIRIVESMKRKLGRSVPLNQVEAFKNSMLYMNNVLTDAFVPDNAGIAIEYTLPQTAKRIDFILTGLDPQQRETAVIIELKQWTKAKLTSKDAIVETYISRDRGESETQHPSYQAWSYACLLEDYNETVRNEKIALVPCAYLHNCVSKEIIHHPFYAEHTKNAPSFVKDETTELKNFIQKYIKYGDSRDIMYRIDHGKIRPSKSLADSLASLLSGNKEFIMIDDQKLVFETALQLAAKSSAKNKNVLIVQGGPGTGKSVVAINLLVELTKDGKVAQYVTRNSAPRVVYESKLTGTFTKTRIGNLFKGSGAYMDAERNIFDVLIVDEAHRLNEKSGMFQNLGENQIKEIINASTLSIFFLDEDQRVTLKDIGETQEIRQWAKKLKAHVYELELLSQFRCNGSDGYLAWLDNGLQIRETANETLENIDYVFQVMDSPNDLRDKIFEKNLINNKARIVAGYCWDWVSKKEPGKMDIEFPKFGFAMQWNLANDGNLWILKQEAVKEIGCIHTCQGLELDYIGVIIGPDLFVREKTVLTDGHKRAKSDSSVKGFKTLEKKNPDEARRRIASIVKNTYRTLMTRGQKGCYIYCTDPETNNYFKELLGAFGRGDVPKESPKYSGLTLKVLYGNDIKPYQNSVPIYNFKIAAGDFSKEQPVEENDWVELPEPFIPKPGFFVAQVIGESMNKKIPNGSWCLFKSNPVGSRQGKIVLVQHNEIHDVEMGGHLTVKRYFSEKIFNADETWQHWEITLKPETYSSGYKDIVLKDELAGQLTLIGEFVAVLG